MDGWWTRAARDIEISDPTWYGEAIVHRRGRPKAKVAVARKLLVRLFIILRDQIDSDVFCRRGRTAPASA